MELVFKPAELFNRCEPEYLSGSVAELGPCAGEWQRGIRLEYL